MGLTEPTFFAFECVLARLTAFAFHQNWFAGHVALYKSDRFGRPEDPVLQPNPNPHFFKVRVAQTQQIVLIIYSLFSEHLFDRLDVM